MYEELIKKLRYCGNAVSCLHCPYWAGCGGSKEDLLKAADAIEEMQKCIDGIEADNDSLCKQIEELRKAAKAMHTWIFLNSVDEQAAYDECGLTDKMNVALGYGGQFVAEMSKEE